MEQVSEKKNTGPAIAGGKLQRRKLKKKKKEPKGGAVGVSKGVQIQRRREHRKATRNFNGSKGAVERKNGGEKRGPQGPPAETGNKTKTETQKKTKGDQNKKENTANFIEKKTKLGRDAKKKIRRKDNKDPQDKAHTASKKKNERSRK